MCNRRFLLEAISKIIQKLSAPACGEGVKVKEKKPEACAPGLNLSSLSRIISSPGRMLPTSFRLRARRIFDSAVHRETDAAGIVGFQPGAVRRRPRTHNVCPSVAEHDTGPATVTWLSRVTPFGISTIQTST